MRDAAGEVVGQVELEDGPLQFGWDPFCVLVAGPRPVVEALSFFARNGIALTASGAHRRSEHSCRPKGPSLLR